MCINSFLRQIKQHLLHCIYFCRWTARDLKSPGLGLIRIWELDFKHFSCSRGCSYKICGKVLFPGKKTLLWKTLSTDGEKCHTHVAYSRKNAIPLDITPAIWANFPYFFTLITVFGYPWTESDIFYREDNIKLVSSTLYANNVNMWLDGPMNQEDQSALMGSLKFA